MSTTHPFVDPPPRTFERVVTPALPIEKTPTPYHDELRARVYRNGRDVTIEIDKKTSFAPANVQFAARATQEYTDPVEYTGKHDVLSVVEIRVYCDFRYGDDETRSAVVEIDWRSNDVGGRVYAHTRATRYKNGRFVDMPAGARRKVGDRVQELLGDIDWPRLATETQYVEYVHEVNAKAEAVNRQLDIYNKLADRGATILPLAGHQHG